MGDTDPFVCYIPKRCTTFHLIRWVHVGGEWRSETLVGDYLGSDHEHWRMRVGDREVDLDRDLWSPYEL